MKHILRALRLMTKERDAVGKIDFWYGYQVALQNLFVRFSSQLSDQDPKVLKSLSPDKDLTSDFKNLSEVMEKCR
jgi:predicted nucleotidyltransferase